MGEYDSPNRPLPWPLKNALVFSRTVEPDDALPASSFVWPDDPDERVPMMFYLSLNEYNVLGSTIDVGSDIAYGADALRVVWLWLRNMRVNVPICDLVDACITGNPATIAAIVAQLIINPTFNEYLTTVTVGGNIYPPRPTVATPDPLCNAATYCVSKIRELISQIYDDLETLDASEVLSSLLGLFGWRSSPLYQLIGLLETADKTALLAAFDAAAPDLICELIEAELDQEPILAWIAGQFPSPSVLGDALTYGLQSAADDGKWAQWIAVGATMTGADCDHCADGPRWALESKSAAFNSEELVFIEQDGDWDVWTGTAVFLDPPAPAGSIGPTFSNGMTYAYGVNVGRIDNGTFVIDTDFPDSNNLWSFWYIPPDLIDGRQFPPVPVLVAQIHNSSPVTFRFRIKGTP